MENPDRAPEASTASTINTPRVVSERTYDHKYVYVGKNAEKWEQHRVACGGCSQPTFAAHLLSLHEKHCPRNPSQSLGVKLEVDDPMEGEGSVGAEKDKIRISLDGDLARQWRHLQTLAGYEAAEMEYLCWLMNIAEQMLGWKGPPSTTVGDNFDNNEDSSGMLAQNMPMDVPTPGTSTDDSSYTRFKPRRLPEYQIQTPTQDTDMDQDVKPDIVPAAAATSTDTSAQGSLTKFTLDWGKKPSATAPPTSVETDTTSWIKEEITDMANLFCAANEQEFSSGRNVGSITYKDDNYLIYQSSMLTEEESKEISCDDTDDRNNDPSWPVKKRSNKSTVARGSANLTRTKANIQRGVAGKSQNNKSPTGISNLNSNSEWTPSEKHNADSTHVKTIFEDEEFLKPYRRKRIRPNKKDYVKSDRFCLMCKKYFPEQYSFDMHCHREHGGEKPVKKRICVYCGAFFGTIPTLRAHMRHIHENPEKVNCTICDKQIQKRSINIHMEFVHSTERCCCDLCGRTLKNKASLRSHMLASHLEARSIPCKWPNCGRLFNSQRHLKVHMLQHTGEMPVACKLCDYRCKQTSSLTWHMKKRHPSMATHGEITSSDCHDVKTTNSKRSHTSNNDV